MLAHVNLAGLFDVVRCLLGWCIISFFLQRKHKGLVLHQSLILVVKSLFRSLPMSNSNTDASLSKHHYFNKYTTRKFGELVFLPVFTTCNTHFLPHVIQKHWGLQETTNPLHVSLYQWETIIFILLFSMQLLETLNVCLCRCSPSKRPICYVYHGWTDLEWK